MKQFARPLDEMVRELPVERQLWGLIDAELREIQESLAELC